MQIVYATGRPRFLEFHLTDKREAVPPPATVFAVCAGGRTIENQDEDLFDAMTDEEYFTLRAMVSEAERLEKESEWRARGSKQTLARRLLRRLSALMSGEKTVAGNARPANDSAPIPREYRSDTAKLSGYPDFCKTKNA